VENVPAFTDQRLFPEAESGGRIPPRVPARDAATSVFTRVLDHYGRRCRAVPDPSGSMGRGSAAHRVRCAAPGTRELCVGDSSFAQLKLAWLLLKRLDMPLAQRPHRF
jgi:hypothetical protein